MYSRWIGNKLLLVVLLSIFAHADDVADAPAPDGIRQGGTLSKDQNAPAIPGVLTPKKKPVRNYPDQPPTIPHTIRNYQITTNFNQCLSCHSRARSPLTGATMVSITHYQDRDLQSLAAVSPRRYFCLQCHVPQHDVDPATGSDFEGMEVILQREIAE